MIAPRTSSPSSTTTTTIVMKTAPAESKTVRRKHPASNTSSFLARQNQKRQRRQAAGALVAGLFSGNSSVTSASPSTNNNNAKKKSTAQPRPQIQIPPRGIGPVHEPNEHDVLCGRGGRINAHPGNVQFRNIVVHRKKEYLAPTTKKLAKAHIAADIVRNIRSQNPSGRFLKEDSDGSWWDIGDQKAIKKVGQALREDAPDIRQEIHSDEEDDGKPSTMAAPARPTTTTTTTPETIATIPIATAISGRGAKVITTTNGVSPANSQQQHQQPSFQQPRTSYQQIIPPAAANTNSLWGTGQRNTAISGAAAAAVGADDNPLYPPPVDVAFGRQFHIPDAKEDSMISGMSGLSGGPTGGGGGTGGTQLSGMSGISALTDPMSSLSGAAMNDQRPNFHRGAGPRYGQGGMLMHPRSTGAPPVFHTSSGRTMNTLNASDLRSIGGMSLQRSLSWQSGRDNMSWAEHSLAGGGILDTGTVVSGYSSYHQPPHYQQLREEQLAAANALAMQQQQPPPHQRLYPQQQHHHQQQQQGAYPNPAQMYQGTNSNNSGSGSGERGMAASSGASVASMSVASVGGASIMSDLSENLLALDLAEPRLLDRRYGSNNS